MTPVLFIEQKGHEIQIMIVELEKTVPVQLIEVLYKDLMKLLVYCLYCVRQNKLNLIYGVLTDTFNWHSILLNIKGKLEIMEYNFFNSNPESETQLLAFLPKLLKDYDLLD